MSKHITEEQRYAISMMLQIPMSKKAIAEAIGVDKSTVYREIKRNCDARSGSYSMELAQRKADRRKQQKHRKEVLTPAMRKRIIKLLKKGFSPEQIVGRSRLEGIAMVSHETMMECMVARLYVRVSSVTLLSRPLRIARALMVVVRFIMNGSVYRSDSLVGSEPSSV